MFQLGSSAFVLLIVDVDEPSVRICAKINCGTYIRAPHVITCLVKSKYNQRTNGPVNAHLISWPSKAQNIQILEKYMVKK